MDVKYWSSAGLMLTYWCNAQCACCYVSCGPQRQEKMGLDQALSLWEQLIAASPHGCRVHLTGGEPFGDWAGLIELCRHARRQGLGPLQAVETNGFWATDDRIVRDWLAQLDEAGMGRLAISADPYHQQFVPIENCRRLARLAMEHLGASRVLVRWSDWLATGQDLAGLPERERLTIFQQYLRKGRERLAGRAAALGGADLMVKKWRHYADTACREPLLRSRHVHIDAQGRVTPGTCAGIILGQVDAAHRVGDIWQGLAAGGYADRPVVGALVERGPAGLLELADKLDVTTLNACASKCQWCWEIRRRLARRGLFADEVGPAWQYGVETGCPGEFDLGGN